MRRRQVVLGALGVTVAAAATGVARSGPTATESRERLLARIAAAARRTFGKDELRADLAYLCDALLNICVEPFQQTPRVRFEALRARVEATWIDRSTLSTSHCASRRSSPALTTDISPSVRGI